MNQYGFATLAAIAMGWFIYFIYKFTTENIKQKLTEANSALIGLLDRIRMLDNDIIRLRSKLNTVLDLKSKKKSANLFKKSFGNSSLDRIYIPSFDCSWNFASSLNK